MLLAPQYMRLPMGNTHAALIPMLIILISMLVVLAEAGFIQATVTHFIGNLDLQMYILLLLIQYLPSHQIYLLITKGFPLLIKKC